MDLGDYLREPAWAGFFAALVTAVYMHIKAHINNEGKLTPNQYIKPSVLIGLLVAFIVSYGVGSKETISKEPFN